MNDPLYTIHARALLAESVLTAEHRKALDDTVAQLVGLPEEDWSSRGGRRLSLPEPTFLFDLGPTFRVFLKPKPDGRPEVLDFVDQETLDLYFSPRAARGKPKTPLRTGSRS